MVQAQQQEEAGAESGTDRWRAEVARVLRGASIDRLTRQTLDGPDIRPLYGPDDLPGREPAPLPLLPGGQRGHTLPFGWTIMQRHELADPILANRTILDDLANGASGVVLAIDTALAQGSDLPDGIVVLERRDLDLVLDEVRLDLAPMAIDAGPRGLELAGLILDLLDRSPGLRPAEISLGIDPVGCAARGLGDAAEAELAAAVVLARRVLPTEKRIRTFRADGRRWHDAGASDAQELAFTLATAVLYLRALEAEGVPLAAAAGAIELTLAADDDLLATMAKLRAARLLWGRILHLAGVAAPEVRLHAETARRMLTRDAAYLNILRGTIATFAAACAGADSITVLPLDAATGPGDGFSRRIARNLQLILAEESNIFRSLDPAAGSYAIESLTMELARLAWTKLQAIEADGGMLAALRSGLPQDEIAALARKRANDIATRRRPITGVSEFPELDEVVPPCKLPDMSTFLAEAKRRRRAPERQVVSGPSVLRPERLAKPFERLRQRARNVKARHGSWPRLYLATLGSPAEFTERANWLQNLLAAGGIEAVLSGPLANGDDAAAGFARSGTVLAALCGSDRAYEAHAAAAATALKSAGCSGLYLVGRPPVATEATWRTAGIDDFVHAGTDALEWLVTLHTKPVPESGGERP